MNIRTLTGRKNTAIKEGVRTHRYALRIVGSEKLGFRLGAQIDPDIISVFGFTHKRQADAINYGLATFNIAAVKFTAKRTTAPALDIAA